MIFRTKSGRAVDRSNIFHEMKRLCREASVEAAKVFPHNFRHLFARMFYAVEKTFRFWLMFWDIVGLKRLESI